MKNEKLTTGRAAVNNQDVREDIKDIINVEKDYHLVTKDEGQERPIIIGRVPGTCRTDLLNSRLNWGERAIIAIPVERNRSGSHNIAVNFDFDLPLAIVKEYESGVE